MARHLAQLNVAILRHAIDDPRTKDFADALADVNALGESSPGYVWRLQSDSGNATDIQVFADPLVIVNLTVWESLETLKAFAYRGVHRDFFRRRAEWFVHGASRTALWWIAAGTIPTTDDATRRLAFIDAFGQSPYAFEIGHVEPPLVIHRVSMPDGALVVAELDDQIVGSAAYRRSDPAAGEAIARVDRIYVGAPARGMRIGAAMVAELEATARADGMATVELETRNPVLCELYEAFGYRRHPNTARGGSERATWLTKALSTEPVRLA